jgi:hypothetical protein
MKIRMPTKLGEWLIIIAIILALISAGFITYSVVDCLTTGCVSTDDHQHAAEVRSEALEYAEQDCYKSYKQAGCKQLTVHDASFVCGFMGFCGWTVNIKSSGSFQYNAGLDLESFGTIHSKYKVTVYYEANTPYTQNLEKIFLSMCHSYKPSAKLGCDPTYISPTIDWLGDDNVDNNQSVGVAVSNVYPYQFEAKINRGGHILGPNITNPNVSSKVLYKYTANQ